MARITDIRDALVARLQSYWSVPYPATVHTSIIGDVDLATTTAGKHVWIFREGVSGAEPVNRQQDKQTYLLRINVSEFCTTTGLPSDSWLESRIEWVEENIWDRIRATFRNHLTVSTPAATAILDAVEWATLYDVEMMQSSKLFLAEISASWRIEE